MPFVAPTALRGIGLVPACAEPISCGVMAATTLAPMVINYWKQQSLNNRNKVIATEDANSYSRAVYGFYPDCTQPTGGVPVVPGTTDYKFCSASVAGMVERCQVNEAATYFGFLVSDMQQLSNQFSYFRNWFNSYGIGMIGDMQGAIMNAHNVCGVPVDGSGGGGGTIPPTNGGGGISVGISGSTMMLLGFGLFAMLMLRR